jgi:hypothetical protein
MIAESSDGVNHGDTRKRQQFTPMHRAPLRRKPAAIRNKVQEGERVKGEGNAGRGERIRTSGLYVPNVALYQAKLHPEFPGTANAAPLASDLVGH